MDLRKVYGGTPMGQAPRCDTCVYARIIRGYAQSEKITLCDRIFEPIRIPFSVSECTDYVDKRLPCRLGAEKQERRETCRVPLCRDHSGFNGE